MLDFSASEGVDLASGGERNVHYLVTVVTMITIKVVQKSSNY